MLTCTGVFLVIRSAYRSHGIEAPCTTMVRMLMVPTKNTVMSANLHPSATSQWHAIDRSCSNSGREDTIQLGGRS